MICLYATNVRGDDDRPHAGFVLAYLEGQVIQYKWIGNDDPPPEFKLIHDAGGRAEATAEFKLRVQIAREHEAMLEAMKRAVAMLSCEGAREVREFYKERLARAT
jgi:hypothetical protein